MCLRDRKGGLDPEICCCVSYRHLLFPSLAWAWRDGEVESPPEENQKTKPQWKEESVLGPLAFTPFLPDLFGDSPEEGGSQLLSLVST